MLAGLGWRQVGVHRCGVALIHDKVSAGRLDGERKRTLLVGRDHVVEGERPCGTCPNTANAVTTRRRDLPGASARVSTAAGLWVIGALGAGFLREVSAGRVRRLWGPLSWSAGVRGAGDNTFAC